MKRYQTFSQKEKGDSDSFAKLEAIKLQNIDLKGKSFLDLGCNEGFFCGKALEFGASRVVGIDASPEYIGRARERFPDAQFFCQTWNFLPDEQFDVIIMLSALHYDANPKRLMRRIYGILKDDGVFILETGVSKELIKVWFEVPRGVGSVHFPTEELLIQDLLSDFSVREIKKSVSQAGDPLERYVYYCHKLKPVVIIFRGGVKSGKTTACRLLMRKGVNVFQTDQVLVRSANFHIKPESAQLKRFLDGANYKDIEGWIDSVNDSELGELIGKFLYNSMPKETEMTIAEGYTFENPHIYTSFINCLHEKGFKVWETKSL